jgi:nucleoid DNA-binding protein
LSNLTKKEIAKALSEMPSVDLPVTKVEDVINGLIVIIRNGLMAGKSVELRGLLKATIVERAARQGHNPRTGEKVAISAKKTVTIKAAKELKAAVN